MDRSRRSPDRRTSDPAVPIADGGRATAPDEGDPSTAGAERNRGGLRPGYEGSLPGETWFKEVDAAVVRADRCVRCGTCVAACPVDTIGVADDGRPVITELCIGCSQCWDFCPRGGLRYERQWTAAGGEDNVDGIGAVQATYSAKVTADWHARTQDGGVVTAMLVRLLETGAIDGAVIATESETDPWRAEPFVATTPEECVENAGSFYNQPMALDRLDARDLERKLPDVDLAEGTLALVATPCVIEGVRALQAHEWDYGSHEDGVRAIDYTIGLMCTKNFDYDGLVRDRLEGRHGIAPEDVGKFDVVRGDFVAFDRDGEELLRTPVEDFHEAALAGCDECADFVGYCADVAVGSVGSPDGYSSVVVRTDAGREAWDVAEPVLEARDLEAPGAIERLQRWDASAAADALERPLDPEAARFVPYDDHADRYGVDPNPYDPSVKGEPGSR